MAEVKIKNKRRLFLLQSSVLFAFLALIMRLGYIQIVKNEWLTEKALAQQVRDIPIEAKRGTIYDRNGKEMAISITKYTVWAKPSSIGEDIREKTAEAIAQILQVEKPQVLSDISKDTNGLVRIARWIDEEPAKKIQEEGIKGVWIVKDNKRYYPYGNFAPYVIGHVSSDNAGQAGVELEYDKELRGLPGRMISITDASGRDIPYENGKYNESKDGSGLILTIDEVVQHHLEKALDKGLVENNAKSVMGIVMDPNTGEILAMGSKPDYNPNDPRMPIYPRFQQEFAAYDSSQKVKGWFDMWKNPLVNATYEPGSTFKPVTVSAALEEGLTYEGEKFYCNGYAEVAGRKIKCHVYPRKHGEETLAQAVQNSCNPIMIELGQRLERKKLYEYIKAFGLMSKTGVDLPGEQVGIYHREENVGPVELATISFGQANSVTPIQLITAISAIANDGVLMKPHVVKAYVDSKGSITDRIEPEQVRTVISKETARTMRRIMESVVSEGGGNRAFIPGYHVGGKTGTAQKVIDGRYAGGCYYASFMGMAPSERPDIVTLIVIDEPNGISPYGGVVAAPIAKEVMYDTLRYLNVKPNYYVGEGSSLIIDEAIIPDVRNITLGKAKQILEESLLKPVIEPANTEFTDENIVMDMFPSPNTKIPAGSSVMLYMKLDVKDQKTQIGQVVTVPEVSGKSIKEAGNILQGIGLKLKATGSGTAVGQEPAAGSVVGAGSVVSVEFN